MFLSKAKTEHQNSREVQESVEKLCSYPVEMSAYLTLSDSTFDLTGIPLDAHSGRYHPILIARYALAHWNQHFISEDQHCNIFLVQARWFVEHKIYINEDTVGWPIPLPSSKGGDRDICLSASVQGCALSVLTRAYQLTKEEVFLEVARLASRTFVQDILDGGVCAPIGEDGVFFEETAVYPATHNFKGLVSALFGLYDYVAITEDATMKGIIERSLSTMHTFLEEFDTGFWLRADLLHRQLVSREELFLYTELLSALAAISGCEHCLQCSLRWRQYQRQAPMHLRYSIAHCKAICRHVFRKYVQAKLFPSVQASYPLRICIPITAFPITGGIRTVLAGIAQVTAGQWQIEYQTQRIGPDADSFTIHKFGTARMTPWRFPMLWLYFLAGLQKLLRLLHSHESYHIILPQDGVFTGAFAAVAGKLAGVRVVCIDHGNFTLLDSQAYRDECLEVLSDEHWMKRICLSLLYTGYWPSLKLLARITARCTDHFLIPGVVGDGTENIYAQLHIAPSRITRFGSMIEAEQYSIVTGSSLEKMRKESGIAADAVVVAVVCRLVPAKGLHVALESLEDALRQLSPDQAARVCVIIAGDGPLRSYLEEGIRLRGLGNNCVLWGEISKPDVISLLRISDIFLYTSTRGACMSMAVLEAMASGCAVIASTRPLSNARLLADGRGIAIPAEDVEQTSQALVLLLNNLELCHQMGTLARNYVAQHHNAALFRRSLLRVTNWSSLRELLIIESGR